MSALQEQLAYLEASSSFYRERLGGVREHVHTAADLPLLPFTTKDELREGSGPTRRSVRTARRASGSCGCT